MTTYALDARTATNHFPGIGRYVVSMAGAMTQQLVEGERLVLLRDPTQPSVWDLGELAGGPVELVDAPLSPFRPEQQWAVPQQLREQEVDLYHSPYYLMPYLPGVPSLVTIHDLIPVRYPHYIAQTQRIIFGITVRLAARVAQRVISVSQATAHDLADLLGLSVEKTVTIAEAAAPAFQPASPFEVEEIRARFDLPERYVLYLGSNKPHKNLARLVEAWARVQPQSMPLVIAGVWDERYPEPRRRAEELELDEEVLFLGPLAEPYLPALYTGATAFVFPSEYEGFGLPVLEAMACGTPVACSDVSSLPEVAGDAALKLDPVDVDSIAGAIQRLLSDPDLRADLRERGLRQAASFTWERTAHETLALYRQMVE
jgi:alpha-1,3-rhamnosyl/mannosyltransferase